MLNFDSDDNKLSKAELNSSRDNSVQSKVIKDRQIKELHRIVRLVRSKLLKCHNKDKNGKFRCVSRHLVWLHKAQCHRRMVVKAVINIEVKVANRKQTCWPVHLVEEEETNQSPLLSYANVGIILGMGILLEYLRRHWKWKLFLLMSQVN